MARLTIKNCQLVYGKQTKYGPKTLVLLETDEYPGTKVSGFFDPNDKRPQEWGNGTVLDPVDIVKNGQYVNFKLQNAQTANKEKVTKLIEDIHKMVLTLYKAYEGRTQSNPPNATNDNTNVPHEQPYSENDEELPF